MCSSRGEKRVKNSAGLCFHFKQREPSSVRCAFIRYDKEKTLAGAFESHLVAILPEADVGSIIQTQQGGRFHSLSLGCPNEAKEVCIVLRRVILSVPRSAIQQFNPSTH